MNLTIGAGKELAGGIVHIHFDEERARVGGYRSGVPNEVAMELASGKFCERENRRQPRLGSLGVLLRHTDIDAQRPSGSDLEQSFGRATARTGIDQLADVGIACSDDAVKRCIDILE